MSQPALPSNVKSPQKDVQTLLVGNPNVGKSVLFGLLTGSYANVSNYPGTTVEITRGQDRRGPGYVVDTPGTNSLLPGSEDERVTRDLLLEGLQSVGTRVIQVADAKNLRRGVMLAMQLSELELPSLFVANMMDESRSRGFSLDIQRLEKELGQSVIGTVATRREGTGPLLSEELEYRSGSSEVRYDPLIEEAIEKVRRRLPESLRGRRGIALMLIAGDRTLLPWARDLLGDELEAIQELQDGLSRRLGDPIRFSINRSRLAAADRIVARCLVRESQAKDGFLSTFGDMAFHPLWGVPVAACILYVLYLFVGVLGAGYAVDFLENGIFAEYITPWSDKIFRVLLPSGLEAFMVGPPGTEIGTGPGLMVGEYGLVSMALSYSVAIVLPIVGFFFIAFSVMEDSGYLPRLAVVLNRVFKLIGLNGKAVLPMVLGLGCDTMATMTTRILATRKERVLTTLLLALGVPCSAQLGVILGMLAALSAWGTMIWLGAVAGVLFVVGYLADKVMPGQSSDFVLEIPPMRRPSLLNITIKTVARVEWYLKEAVPLFLLGTFVLWLLDRLQILGTLQTLASPIVVSFLGLPAKATDAFLIGFLRRDYGAAGLYSMFQDELAAGNLAVETEIQVVVAMVTITLFVPCIANIFMIVKEHGMKTAVWMSLFIFPFAVVVGGALNHTLRALML
jgi:ferrous iron transport protein B